MAIHSYLRQGSLPYSKKYVSNVRATVIKENDIWCTTLVEANPLTQDSTTSSKWIQITQARCFAYFWSDGYSRKMCDLHGDSLSFDTTYNTNKYNLHFVPHVGASGHWQNCLFVRAIIQNETIGTFTLHFETLQTLYTTRSQPQNFRSSGKRWWINMMPGI